MLEEAIQLWLSAIRNATEYTRELHELFPTLISILDYDSEYNSEYGSICADILRSYFLVGQVHLFSFSPSFPIFFSTFFHPSPPLSLV